MSETLYLGVDFSGNYRMWRQLTRSSNVWIAEISERHRRLELRSLCPVQCLSGDGDPFDRLAMRLRAASYQAAALDAPFSIPAKFLRRRSHAQLLTMVGELSRSTPERPFAEARRFVKALTGAERCNPPKPLRRTEVAWQARGVNVRSTLWCGCRGGAAMTAACMTLLDAVQRRAWPWAGPEQPGLLVEAFPAAQLCHWGLPYDRYNEPAQRKRRARLVGAVARRLVLPTKLRKAMVHDADALDAVLCAIAARAVVRGTLVSSPPEDLGDEGWIAVCA